MRKVFCNTLFVAMALLSLEACDDAPTAVEVTAASSPATIQLTTALVTIRDLLNDPLVASLIAEADHSRGAKRTTRAMAELNDAVMMGDPQVIGHALTDAQRELTQAPGEARMLARTALSFMLDAFHTLLNDTTHVDAGTTDVLVNTRRSR